jgi:hypothetical protein
MGKSSIPCGPNGSYVVPQNTMSSREILKRYIRALQSRDLSVIQALSVSPMSLDLDLLDKVPYSLKPTIRIYSKKPCTDTYTISFAGHSMWEAVLQRQYKARLSENLGQYQIPPNSLYWRLQKFTRLT